MKTWLDSINLRTNKVRHEDSGNRGKPQIDFSWSLDRRGGGGTCQYIGCERKAKGHGLVGLPSHTHPD